MDVVEQIFWPAGVEEYARLIGSEAVDRILRKAKRLHDLRVLNVSSTFYGGGVAEILGSLTLLERGLGLRADWRLIQGNPDFFNATKCIHNALQGGDVPLEDAHRRAFEETVFHNSIRMDLAADVVIVHDPQPLPLVTHYRRTCPWIWRCHIDLSEPEENTWQYVAGFVEQYDTVVLSLPAYRRPHLTTPQVFFTPAIDPFSVKNRELGDDEIDARLARYEIPTGRPIVAQIARFDRWKDPEGVIEAFRKASKEVDATLVLLGDVATDDPEGQEVFESLLSARDERIHILTAEDSLLVNALQRRAAVILQKSLREGFGLTVTEAMWKGAAVIGGDCGGIRHQIDDGENGFLVRTVDEAAARIVALIGDPELRKRLGAAARETVRQRYLMSRLVEDYLDLFVAFEPSFAPRSLRVG